MEVFQQLEEKLVQKAMEGLKIYTDSDLFKLHQEMVKLGDAPPSEHFLELMQNIIDSQPSTANTTRSRKKKQEEPVDRKPEGSALRPRRKAFETAANATAAMLTEKLGAKLRRPSNNSSTASVYIKTEPADDIVKVKKERLDMPPPAKPPAKRGRTKRKKAGSVSSEGSTTSTRDSEVALLPNQIPTVVLNDTVDEPDHDEEQLSKAKKSKEAVVIIQNSKRVSDQIKEKEESLNATTVLQQPSVLKQTPQNQESFAVVGNILNATTVLTTPTVLQKEIEIPSILDQTKVIEKPAQIKKTGKVFSAYENSPVKKRVEAFENLAKQVDPNMPTRVTRTKTRALAKQQQTEEENNKDNVQDGKSTSSSESGKLTPGTKCATPSFKSKLPVSSGNSSQARTLSAMKSYQQSYRERMKQKEANELEHAKKKEAQLLAVAAEKKRKREEKELKAKQLREQQELERQQLLEKQRQKEEMRKQQLEKERNDKLMRLQEENERKRLIKLKAEKQKQEEAEKKQQENISALANRSIKVIDYYSKPIYMTEPAPLLPTYDCYDSDTEDVKRAPTVAMPDWIGSQAKYVNNRVMGFIDHKLKNTLFCLRAQTLNLEEILPTINPDKLRRNSSAIWQSTPRFTTFKH